MRKEYDFSKATRNPYAGRFPPSSAPIRLARQTRHILGLSLVSGIAAGAAILPGGSFQRTLVLVATSLTSSVTAAVLLARKLDREGWRSIKDPPILASLAFLIPTAVILFLLTTLLLAYLLIGGPG